MLGYLFKTATAALSETVDLAVIAGEAVVDDVASIPDAIVEGWNNGFESLEEPAENETDG